MNKDYLCGVYYYSEDSGWIYSTQNCSEKLRFICEGGTGRLFRYALALYKWNEINMYKKKPIKVYGFSSFQLLDLYTTKKGVISLKTDRSFFWRTNQNEVSIKCA